jgi:HD-GYP domain-containing protein (c-di-GMP phosphodiesterase class II)
MSKEDIEFERFQSMAVFSIREILDAVTKQKEAKGMYQFANQILRRYGSLNHKINFVQNLRSNDDYVYKHSLNTAILAALMSHRMEMEFKQQLDVVVAAILHDIGNLLIPSHIRRKRKNELTEEDEKKIRTYHYAASQLIDNDYDLDPEVKRIVKGFIAIEHQTSGEDAAVKSSTGIEILKVAYAYDTMTAMKFEEEPASEIAALRILLDEKNGYNQNVVNALVASINILQAGVCVELTNGDRGLVVAANDADVLSPIILSFRDNVLYNMSDRYIASEIQIKDIMKTMDNRHVMNNDMLSQYEGSAVHMGEKLPGK